jgi:hypothetical protein
LKHVFGFATIADKAKYDRVQAVGMYADEVFERDYVSTVRPIDELAFRCVCSAAGQARASGLVGLLCVGVRVGRINAGAVESVCGRA